MLWHVGLDGKSVWVIAEDATRAAKAAAEKFNAQWPISAAYMTVQAQVGGELKPRNCGECRYTTVEPAGKEMEFLICRIGRGDCQRRVVDTKPIGRGTFETSVPKWCALKEASQYESVS